MSTGTVRQKDRLLRMPRRIENALPLPRALRLRRLHPLIEGDGSCNRVYDLERAAEVEVPEELRRYIAAELETGDLDKVSLTWLLQEDLITPDDLTQNLVSASRLSLSVRSKSFWKSGDRELKAAEFVFGFLEVLLPRRLRIEDLGDAREELELWVQEKRPLWQIYGKMVSTIFWVGLNGVREVMSIFGHKKSED